MMCNDVEGLCDSFHNNSNMTNVSSSDIYSDAEASTRQHAVTKSNEKLFPGQKLLKAPRVTPHDKLHSHELSHFGYNSKESEY